MLLLAPLLISEFGSAFDIDQVIAHGTLPEFTPRRIRVYAPKTCADLPIPTLGKRCRRRLWFVGVTGRLLELITAASGRILNLNALCRDARLSYGTVRRYDDVLEDMLLAFRVLA